MPNQERLKFRGLKKRLWRSFHLWTFAALGVVTVANIASILRPFNAPSPPASTGAAIILSSNSRASNSTSAAARVPASAAVRSIAASRDLVEIAVSCDPKLEIAVPESVKQLRLRLQPCTSAKVRENYYIRNSTNGFEATVFRIPNARNPAAEDAISTDFISLKAGENKIVINISQGQAPAREHTIVVRRN